MFSMNPRNRLFFRKKIRKMEKILNSGHDFRVAVNKYMLAAFVTRALGENQDSLSREYFNLYIARFRSVIFGL